MIRPIHILLFAFLSFTGAFQTLAQSNAVLANNGISSKQTDEADVVTASPNPFEHELTIYISNLKELREIKIFDLIGNEVSSISLNGRFGNHSFKLDTSNLKPGIYFCTLYSEKGIINTQKLLKGVNR